jgi:hypothetical protein
MPASAAIIGSAEDQAEERFRGGRGRDLFIGLEQSDAAAFGVSPIAKPVLNQRPQDHRIDAARKALTGR